jgi:hypothetical protein
MIKAISIFFITTLISSCAQLAVQVAQEVIVEGPKTAVIISESNKNKERKEDNAKSQP